LSSSLISDANENVRAFDASKYSFAVELLSICNHWLQPFGETFWWPACIV